MATWPTSPTWSDINGVNKGNEYAGGDGIYYKDLNIVVNDINYLYKNIDGGTINRINDATTGDIQQVLYNKISGASIKSYAGINYADNTGKIQTYNFQLTSKLPIIPGKYISISANTSNDTLEVKVDDAQLALDYYKISKGSTSNVPAYSPTSGVIALPYSYQNNPSSLIRRGAEGEAKFTYGIFGRWNDIDSGNVLYFSDIYAQLAGYGALTVTATTGDKGTLSVNQLEILKSQPQRMILYKSQLYYRMDPNDSPDGTMSYVHIDSVQDENDSYKATGKSFTIRIGTRAWKVVDLEFGGNAPISKGTGTNSLVGNDLATNTAISENVTSFGTGNIGGLKGYYWSNIDLSAKTITLATAHTGGTPVNCGYAVGDTISIVNESKFEECSKITAINGSVITVNSFPFTTVATGAGDFSDYSIYCPAKANIGLADLGRAAWVAGSGNKGGNYCAVVAGRDNNVIGQYGVAVGRSNKVGYAGFSAGRDNTCTGQYGAVAGGSWNNLTASWAFAAGRANNLNGLYSGSFGRNNSAGVRGYYFTNSGSGNDILLYSDSACTTPANCSYAVGDVLTAGIGARYVNAVSITSFTGNKVTLSSRINLSDYSASQRFIYCEQKSAVGAAAVTSYATAFGLNCKALGEDGVAAGRNCVVPSTGGVAIGVDNRAGYSSFVGGGDNQTDKEYCVLLGNGNRVTNNQSYAIGQGLKVNSTHQCVVGRYNKPISNVAAFVIGVGTNDTNRKNAMWVTTDGNIVAGGTTLILNGNGDQVSLSADQLTKLLNSLDTEKVIAKTAADTGTLDATTLAVLQSYPQIHIQYDNQTYYRMDPMNAPDGTLNYIHLDSIQDGAGGYSMTGKCFSITVSTRAWQVVDLNTRLYEHDMLLNDEASGTTIRFSLPLKTNSPFTDPEDLWNAMENIANRVCYVRKDNTTEVGTIEATMFSNSKVFQVMTGTVKNYTVNQLTISDAVY